MNNNEHITLLREGAKHLRSATGIPDYPVAVAMNRAADELERADPVAWATSRHDGPKHQLTYSADVADSWKKRGWPVDEFYSHDPKGRQRDDRRRSSLHGDGCGEESRTEEHNQ